MIVSILSTEIKINDTFKRKGMLLKVVENPEPYKKAQIVVNCKILEYDSRLYDIDDINKLLPVWFNKKTKIKVNRP